MNHPATPSAVPPTPPTPEGGSPAPSPRARRFRPTANGAARPPGQPGRLMPRSTPPDSEDLDALLHRAPGSGGPRHPHAPRRPPLFPNAAIAFLQDVHARSNPEQLERRFSLATRTLAATSLAAAVAAVIASSIVFRAPSVSSLTRPAPAPHATNQTAPTTAETTSAINDAITSLHAFLHIPAPDDTPAGAATASPLPDGSLAATIVHHDRARLLLHTDSLKIVLVPVTDTHRLPRTAAILNRGHGWQVDGPSLTTPESAPWADLANGTATSPVRCRVLVSQLPDGSWSLERPGADPPRLTATTDPGARVAAELNAALAARPDQPLAANVFLAAGDGRSCRLIDWSPDKWSL